ncbi:MAG: site-2 protease family protein [Gammaproteobacteria bacterium]
MNHLSTIQIFSIWVLPVLFGITVHEVAHGWVASKLGDNTALLMGRLTLNPLKHIDIIGTVIVPTLLLLFGGFIFGWAKPVPVDWRNLHRPRLDMALVALAGPVANLLMAFFWAAVGKLGAIGLQHQVEWALAFRYMGEAGIWINLILMFLNILPIPPLDGSRVLSALLPTRIATQFARLEPFGFFILLGLLAFGFLQYIILPPVLYSQTWLAQLFNLLPSSMS